MKTLRKHVIIAAIFSTALWYTYNKIEESSKIYEFCSSFPALKLDSNTVLKNGSALIKSNQPMYTLNYYTLKKFNIEKLYIVNTPENRQDLKLFSGLKAKSDWTYIKLTNVKAPADASECIKSEKGILKSLSKDSEDQACIKLSGANEKEATEGSVIEVVKTREKNGKGWFERIYFVLDNKLAINTSSYSDGSIADENGGQRIKYCK